jgi:uncharacterized membrane protein YbhN (UPF0104 family)
MSDLGDAVSAGSGGASGRRALVLTAKLAVTGAILFFLSLKIDLSAAIGRLHEVEPVPLLAAIGLTLGQILVGARRWHVVLAGLGVTVRFDRTLRLFTIGVFFNIFLPTGIGGDAYRMWSLHRTAIALGPAVNSVLLDRLFAVLALCLVILLEYPALALLIDDSPVFSLSPILSLGGLAVIAAVAFLDHLPERWRRGRSLAILATLSSDARRLMLHLRPLATAIGFSLLGIAGYCLTIYCLARSLDIALSPGATLLIVPSVMIVMLLPVSIGGWGLREGALVLVLGTVGISAEAALALSILAGAVVMVVSLAGGVLWLMPSDEGSQPARRGS